MQPLEVFALTKDMERATGSIDYDELEWHRKYYDFGEFTLTVNKELYDPSWAYIYAPDRPETGVILKRTVQDDDYNSDVSVGADKVVLQGLFLEYLLNNVVNLVESVEENRIYVPKPSWPTSSVQSRGAAYKTKDGSIAYKDGSGGYTKADGTAVKEEDLGDRVDRGNLSFGDGSGADYARFYYSTSGTPKIGGTITRTHMAVSGDVSTGTIEYIDKAGNIYYRDNGDASPGMKGGLYVAQGVAVNSDAGEYRRKIAEWERLPSDLNGRYRTVQVAGPWARAELELLTQQRDNIELVYTMARKLMQDNILYDVPTITGIKKLLPDTSIDLTYLGEWMYQELKTVGASFRLFYSFEQNTTVLQFYRGVDRTQEQNSNPWATFSEDRGNLYNFAASVDESNYKNKCYVLYDYDEPNSWTSSGAPRASRHQKPDSSVFADYDGWYIPYTRKAGSIVCRLDDGRPDAETWLDLRTSKPEADGQWKRDLYTDEPTDLPSCRSQYANFQNGLREQGMAYLTSEFGEERSLDTGTLELSEYLEGWDLGDRVDMAVSSLGLVQEARIVECVERHTSGSSTVQIVVDEAEVRQVA